jgi:hypothetical protein
MNFKEFLSESYGTFINKESDVSQDQVIRLANQYLQKELSGTFESPDQAFFKIRKILLRFFIELPPVYDLDEEGDELIFYLKEFQRTNNHNAIDAYLYVLYYLTDDDRYDFYAEITDKENIEKFIEDGEELPEEEN